LIERICEDRHKRREPILMPFPFVFISTHRLGQSAGWRVPCLRLPSHHLHHYPSARWVRLRHTFCRAIGGALACHVGHLR
jgi:hypothetical protein